MHRLVVPNNRSVLRICDKHNHDTSPPRKSRRTTCCYVSESSNNRRPQKKVGRKAKKNLFHEFSENESSKGNIEENRKNKSLLPRRVSTDSVIYVGTTNSNDINSNNIPVVDLTNSSDNLSCSERIVYPKTLKTIYFPSKNFDRDITLRKNLITSSLINLPVIRKPIVQRRLCSASVNNKQNRQRLALLSLPEQDLDSYHFFCEDNVSSKVTLNESDEKIIDWILEQEVINNSSPDFSSLDTGLDSIPELCKKYAVESDCNFD